MTPSLLAINSLPWPSLSPASLSLLFEAFHATLRQVLVLLSLRSMAAFVNCGEVVPFQGQHHIEK